MRKLIITIVSLVALAAVIAPLANADVNVTAGVGFVGKGDVLTALGYANDAAIQEAVKNKEIKFSLGSAEKVTADYMMSCYGSDAVGHTIIVQPGTMSVTAVARANPQGKLTTGWDLTGTGFIAAGNAFIRTVPCPEGSFMYMNLGQGDLWNKVVPTGDGTLSVTNGVTTVALPNTPVAQTV